MPDISEQELADLRKVAKEGAKAQALYDGLRPQFDDLQKQVATLPELQKQVETYKARELDSTFAQAGVKDAKVRRIFELEYADLQAAEGQEKPALDAWLKGLQESPADKRPAHLAPFLTAPTVVPPGAPPPKVGTPDPNKGASQVQGAPAQFSPETVRTWTPEMLKQNAPALEAQYPELKGLSQTVQSLFPKG